MAEKTSNKVTPGAEPTAEPEATAETTETTEATEATATVGEAGALTDAAEVGAAAVLL